MLAGLRRSLATMALVVTWVGSAAVVGSVLVLLAHFSRPSPDGIAAGGAVSSPVPPERGPRVASGTPGWRVVYQLSAEHVAVIEVETTRPDDALRIARILVEQVKAHYSEMLIYFHRPGERDRLPAARVQWRPDAGYVLMRY